MDETENHDYAIDLIIHFYICAAPKSVFEVKI